MKSLNPANDNNTILIVRRWQKICNRNQNVNFFPSPPCKTPPWKYGLKKKTSNQRAIGGRLFRDIKWLVKANKYRPY